jgi:hypothetical protein
VVKNATAISYAYPFYNLVSAGMRVNFLQERVFSTSGNALGFDMSVYSKPIKGLSAGFAVNNINRPKITLDETPDIYGRHMKCGIAYHAKKDLFIIAIDANKLEEQNAYYVVGAEINPVRYLSLRAGLDQNSAVTAGVGISVWPIRVDYAFSNHEELGVFNKISFMLRWGNIYQTSIEPLGKNTMTGSIEIQGLLNELLFKTTVPQMRIKEWKLEIKNPAGAIVRSLGAQKRPPEKISWDMNDEAGRPAARGNYRYTFKVEYDNDRSWENTGNFELGFSEGMHSGINIKMKGEKPPLP